MEITAMAAGIANTFTRNAFNNRDADDGFNQQGSKPGAQASRLAHQDATSHNRDVRLAAAPQQVRAQIPSAPFGEGGRSQGNLLARVTAA
jgi:hypothetical protein